MIDTVEVKKQIEVAYKSRNFNAACSAIALVGKARKEKDQNLTDDLLMEARICMFWIAKCNEAIQNISMALQAIMTDPSEITLSDLKTAKEEAIDLFDWDTVDPNLSHNVDTVIAVTEGIVA